MKCFNLILILDFFMRFHCSVVDVSKKFFDTVFGLFHQILLSLFSMKCSDTAFCLFLEVLLLCGRPFPCSALILFLVSLGHLSYSGDLLLCVRVRRRPSCVNIFSSRTTGPILTKFGM